MIEQIVRFSVGQVIVCYLIYQYIEWDGVECCFICGVFGIFGYGNVIGLGQVFLQNEVVFDDEEG